MTFLNVLEIESALAGLASAHPGASELITLPFFTAEGRQSHALRIGQSECARGAVLIISGAHGREWGGPDICVGFAADLLEAWSLGSGLAYGGTSYTARDIRSIMEGLDVIVFPDLNPDGRHYSQTAYSMWRKNRNPASSGGVASRIGVDVNRNYDFLWDYTTAFAPAAQATGSLASTNPADDLFHGTAPFSEAESRNVRWLFQRFPRIRWYIDIHAYGGDILHPWGDDANQLGAQGMNFTNPAWNGQRGLAGDTYAEYVGASDLATLQAAATAMRAAIAGVRGQSYAVAQSFFLPGWATPYPTSGASDDWAFSRYFSDPSKPRVRAFTLEFNKTPTFFPPWSEMQNVILDVDAGLVALCLEAAPSPGSIFSWCWWRRLFEGIWRRLWPPDLWGPYGPWGRVRQVVERILEPLLRVMRVGGRRP